MPPVSCATGVVNAGLAYPSTASTHATSTSVDVTNDVLTALNTAMPTIATTAPAQTQQQPQGR